MGRLKEGLSWGISLELTRANKQHVSGRVLVATLVILSMGLWLDAVAPHGMAVSVLYVAPIVLTLFSPGKPLLIGIAVCSSILTVIGHWVSPPGDVWLDMANRSLAILAIWGTTVLVWFHFRAQAQLKVLSGLLPICSSCKKIRNDDGFWQGVERYVQEHSEAHFTHSICPDCAKRLYPGWVEKLNTVSTQRNVSVDP